MLIAYCKYLIIYKYVKQDEFSDNDYINITLSLLMKISSNKLVF